jgi:valyl-tRNA synthetase
MMEGGKTSIRDQFMISRLMRVCETVNDLLASYRFGDAQQAVYALWMDDICDVYLELIKPVIKDESEANKERRWAAQACLWQTLETALRLLHPMMPFVTEELWQRLPGRGTLGADETESIIIARYPECMDAYKNDDVERAMETVMKVVKACRSLRASYSIANKTLTHFYVKVSAESLAAVSNQQDDIMTLGKASALELNVPDDQIPSMVGTLIVDDQLTVLMDVKGLVDFKMEISRLQKNLKSTLPQISQLEAKVSAAEYATKVPDEVRRDDAERLDSLVRKKVELEEAIGNFEKLALMESN